MSLSQYKIQTLIIQSSAQKPCTPVYTVTLNRKGLTNKLEIQEINVLRRTLVPNKEEGEYRRQPNQELYKHTTKIITDVARKSLAFFIDIC